MTQKLKNPKVAAAIIAGVAITVVTAVGIGFLIKFFAGKNDQMIRLDLPPGLFPFHSS